jgi:hypothetical protein
MTRVFTLEEARALMPQVKAITNPACKLSASFAEEIQEAETRGDDKRTEELRNRLHGLVESWAAGVVELGAEVKGLWLVDFDSGDGYWCWAYPEEELSHWHSYEGGFGSRVPLEMRPLAKEVAGTT